MIDAETTSIVNEELIGTCCLCGCNACKAELRGEIIFYCSNEKCIYSDPTDADEPPAWLE